MSYTQIDFPFSAVQGQNLFKKALILTAIYPAIGGVLVSGPRGSAKSTLARALANILPTNNGVSCPFVTLPLGTSLEMLTGTLDLEQILNEKKLQFSPGLLSKVDGGILYVDEVNLLPDHLIDQLLDVAASGVNHVERDGISHSHASKFSLIGTMNPDEGELRGQLKDRFGLMVELNSKLTLEQRVNIVKSREAFETDPQQFLSQYQLQQQKINQKIIDAIAQLSQITCEDSIRLIIAERCDQAGVDGVRADIVMYRAALANAAWRGSSQVTVDDLDAVEELVLVHRRTVKSERNPSKPNHNDSKSDDSDQDANDHSDGSGLSDKNDLDNNLGSNKPSTNPSTSKERNKGGFSRPDAKGNAGPSSSNSASSEQGKKSNTDKRSESDWGSMQASPTLSSVEKVSERVTADLKQLFADVTQPQSLIQKNSDQQSASKASGKDSLSFNNNDVVGTDKSSINWFSTITNSLTQWPKLHLSYHEKQKISNTLHLVLLDTSASTLVQQLSNRAKACVLEISKQAYLKRENIQILGFGNAQVQQILAKVRAPKELDKTLSGLNVAGGTPLRDVLVHAQQILTNQAKQNKATLARCYLITDGRSKAEVSDLQLKAPTVLIDTENSQVKRGRGQSIAADLGAHYYLLQH